MQRTIIHIGSNKTASTTFQRCLFSKSTELNYLGEDGLNFEKHKKLLYSLVSDDDIHCPFEEIQSLFNSQLSSDKNKTFLYSNEDIMTSRLPTVCAKRLHKLMPNAEILIVIRNQLTSVPSIYTNHGAYLKGVPRCYWRKFVSFEDWMNHSINFLNYSYLDSFFYQKILELYETNFGKEKIHILLFEDFIKEPNQFIENMSKILGINSQKAKHLLENKHERRRNTIREYRYHKFRSSFFWGRSISNTIPFGKVIKKFWIQYLAKGKPAGGFLTDYWKSKITELYKNDNTNLSNKYNLPLQEYGYPIDKNKLNNSTFVD